MILEMAEKKEANKKRVKFHQSLNKDYKGSNKRVVK